MNVPNQEQSAFWSFYSQDSRVTGVKQGLGVKKVPVTLVRFSDPAHSEFLPLDGMAYRTRYCQTRNYEWVVQSRGSLYYRKQGTKNPWRRLSLTYNSKTMSLPLGFRLQSYPSGLLLGGILPAVFQGMGSRFLATISEHPVHRPPVAVTRLTKLHVALRRDQDTALTIDAAGNLIRVSLSGDPHEIVLSSRAVDRLRDKGSPGADFQPLGENDEGIFVSVYSQGPIGKGADRPATILISHGRQQVLPLGKILGGNSFLLTRDAFWAVVQSTTGETRIVRWSNGQMLGLDVARTLPKKVWLFPTGEGSRFLLCLWNEEQPAGVALSFTVVAGKLIVSPRIEIPGEPLGYDDCAVVGPVLWMPLKLGGYVRLVVPTTK